MYLLRVKLWELRACWHIIYEEVVSYLRISINSFLVSLGNPLSEDPWVLSVEEEVDSG